MQLFTKASFAATIVHQGRLIAIARSTATGAPAYLYSLQQDDGTWTSPRAFVLPNFEPDPSVAAWLKDHQNFAAALNYRYATADVVPAAPFQVASDDQYVFLFRQSPTNSIYVDRFVFNLNTSTLDATWEVRYQASHQRYHPKDASDELYYIDNNDTILRAYDPALDRTQSHRRDTDADGVTFVYLAIVQARPSRRGSTTSAPISIWTRPMTPTRISPRFSTKTYGAPKYAMHACNRYNPISATSSRTSTPPRRSASGSTCRPRPLVQNLDEISLRIYRQNPAKRHEARYRSRPPPGALRARATPEGRRLAHHTRGRQGRRLRGVSSAARGLHG